MFRSHHSVWPALILTVAALALALPASAAIYTVGTGTGCTHSTIQAAIDTAEASPGFDVVRITRTLSYSAQALQINTSQHLNVVGGFATCNADGDSVKTTISGAGGALAPVFQINAGTGAIIRMRHLFITGGDTAGTGHGGGISFRGNGSLEVIESTITNNLAGYGGGVYAEGTGTAAELIIGDAVLITSNTARYSGGGVYADQIEMAMDAPNSTIAFNTAEGLNDSGYGGGLVILGKSLSAYAYISSGGPNGLGAIYGNTARYGGGVAVVADSNNSGSDRVSELHLYTTDAAQPGVIRGNFASVAGGAIYARSYEGGLTTDDVDATARLWYADLDDNAAPLGAAVYLAPFTQILGIGQPSYLEVNTSAPTRGLPCPIDAPCGSFVNNAAWGSLGYTDGALIQGRPGSWISIGLQDHLGLTKGGVAIRDNRAGRIVDSDGAITTVVNALIVGNQLSQQLIRAARATITDVTIADNSIGSGHILWVPTFLRLKRAILWQPGKTSLEPSSGGTRLIEDVIAHEVASLGGGPEALVYEPRFIDPANGDYHLRAASPAVDFAPPVVGDDRDVNGRPRDQDLPFKANFRGVRDIGAYERPALMPLVLNGDFDIDLNLWPEATANASSWDGNQSASGGAGSGSVQVSMSNAPQPRVNVRRQCIHLPGPGRYALNGWGRSAGFGPSTDAVLLHWQLRHNGGEACMDGVPDIAADHFLTTSSSWVRPANPAMFDLSHAAWTHNSSLTIWLVVIDNGVSFPPAVTGWFDGITLTVEALSQGDSIFTDRFQE